MLYVLITEVSIKNLQLLLEQLIKILCTVYVLHLKIKFYSSSLIDLDYGDSDIVELSEEGVIMDSKYVLEWVMKKVNGSVPVFVWGHSLGTG